MNSDFYAAWKEQHRLKEAQERDWRNDLVAGEIVVAACDIEDTDSGVVREGTRGRVVEPTPNPYDQQVWAVLFGRRKHAWYVLYDPDEEIDEYGDFWGTEIVPLWVWQQRHLPKEERVEVEKPINNPEMYDRPLL